MKHLILISYFSPQNVYDLIKIFQKNGNVSKMRISKIEELKVCLFAFIHFDNISAEFFLFLNCETPTNIMLFSKSKCPLK